MERKLTKRQARYEALIRIIGIIEGDIGTGGLQELWSNDANVEMIVAEMERIRRSLETQVERSFQLRRFTPYEQH